MPAGFAPVSRLADYLLEERIGAGGMAVVFRARDDRLQRRVALKVLAPALAADEAFRHRFIRESQAAAAVDDPHIIPVFEAGEAEGVLFLAMRYVPGGDVRTLVRRAGPLSPAHASAIISPVASALDAAHTAGLVHRDVKLANILIDAHPGRPDHVYLSDFGLSKMVMSSLGPTMAGQFLGTPGYSAPEQLEGKPVDGRADQYSLACATFELLCGQTPFPRDQLAAVIWAHLSEPPPALTSRRPGLPRAVDGVLAKALAKAPADRYASCRAFAEALREALGLAPYNPGSGASPHVDDSTAESANPDEFGAAQPSIMGPEASAEIIDGHRARKAAKPDTVLETTVSWHEGQLEAHGVQANHPPPPATPTPIPRRSSAGKAMTNGPLLHPSGWLPLGHRIAGAVLLAAVAVVAVIAVVIVTVVLPGGNANTTGLVPTGNSPDQNAEQITTAFLTAWQAGDLNQAARYTDHPAQAQAALAAYRKYLHLTKLTGKVQSGAVISAGQPRGSATFALNAAVATPDGILHGTWSYHSKLVAYQKQKSNVWYIAWNPDVLAPNLTTSAHLAAIKVAPQVVAVSDASGKDITSYHDAGLTNIANLMEKQAPPGQGKPGLYAEIQTAKGKPVPNSQAVVIPPHNIANLTTTIDPTAEAAARSAVAMHKNSSMVAIQPSTGKILAIANNAGFNDFALTAKVAPGSTMKVITSAALISSGVLSASSPVACPPTYTVQGITYHNDSNESLGAGTPFVTDFAQSCNNAFSMQWPHLSGGGLAKAAKKYFGLNQEWNIGITGTYFNAPASASGSELAQEAFGEGQLTATPLAMASVAATVSNGTFKQPILLPGTKQVTATPLPAGTVGQLKEMMQAVVTSGTAAGVGFGPGTADIQGQEQPNSWLIAFDPAKDVAIACLVVNAGYGAQFAGPEVKAFFDQV
jgi:serine/threonine protein kinase